GGRRRRRSQRWPVCCRDIPFSIGSLPELSEALPTSLRPQPLLKDVQNDIDVQHVRHFLGSQREPELLLNSGNQADVLEAVPAFDIVGRGGLGDLARRNAHQILHDAAQTSEDFLPTHLSLSSIKSVITSIAVGRGSLAIPGSQYQDFAPSF